MKPIDWGTMLIIGLPCLCWGLLGFVMFLERWKSYRRKDTRKPRTPYDADDEDPADWWKYTEE